MQNEGLITIPKWTLNIELPIPWHTHTKKKESRETFHLLLFNITRKKEDVHRDVKLITLHCFVMWFEKSLSSKQARNLND